MKLPFRDYLLEFYRARRFRAGGQTQETAPAEAVFDGNVFVYHPPMPWFPQVHPPGALPPPPIPPPPPEDVMGQWGSLLDAARALVKRSDGAADVSELIEELNDLKDAILKAEKNNG